MTFALQQERRTFCRLNAKPCAVDQAMDAVRTPKRSSAKELSINNCRISLNESIAFSARFTERKATIGHELIERC